MKRKSSIIALIAAAAIALTGCAQNGANPPFANKEQNVVNYGAVVSVEDIKTARGYVDGKTLMPLYNVSPTEIFEFSFPFNAYDKEVNLFDFVSVHTDAACEDASKIYYNAEMNVEDDKTTLFIKPMTPVLGNSSQDRDYAQNEIDSWGNAPIYYIALHYDESSADAKKLDEPVVIPFTVKHETESPTIKGSVSDDGRFSLSWEPVEGAEKYIVYNLIDDKIKTGVDNHALDGSKIGYDCGQNTDYEKQVHLLREGETTECTFDGFSGSESHSIAEVYSDISKKYSNSAQNFGVMGEFFVTAVVNGKESGLSNAVSTAELRIPHKMTDETKIQNRYDKPSDFPAEVDVLNIDGSITKRKVSYTRSHVKWFEYEWDEFEFTVEGTYIFGSVFFDNDEGEPPVSSGASGEAGNAAPSDNVDKNPSPDVQTIIPAENTADTDAPLVEAQSENTKKHVESAKSDTVSNVPANVYVNADNAEEEWLALNMLNGNESISLEAFPALQNPYYLVDVFYKVYYQNPYMMGIDAFSYDYNTLKFNVKYSFENASSQAQQKEIAEKAAKIVSENIKPEMTAQEKISVIYNYLVNNSVYDKEALEAAKKNNYSKVNSTADASAFNAYGILVNGKGVCMSYAYSFRLLCDLSGVDCSVVTGYLNGNLPHAWNMVKLDGKMYEIDCTNNAVNTGIPYYLYQADSDLAEKSGYVKDEKFALDEKLGEFDGSDNTLEYYRAHGLCPETIKEYSDILVKNLTPDTKTIAVRWNGEVSREEFAQAVSLAYNKLGMEDKLGSLKYSLGSGFIVIVNA